jgi:MoaA/NifB/PqqE/SkfB family radical SAM enzyme
MIKRLVNLITHRLVTLPIVVLMPHSRCNCRCVMCDIWKANHEKRELSIEDLERHVTAFKKLGVKEVVFSGGEALMHSNLWAFCNVLRKLRINITLLSTGLLLSKHAQSVIDHCHEVIVSLDGSEAIHDKIRNIPHAFAKLKEGVQSLKALKPSFRVTGRCVLQRDNFADFLNIVNAAENIGLDQISFLAADTTTSAFNRPEQWSSERAGGVALSPEEVGEFQTIIEQSFVILKNRYDSRFIAENPSKMRRIVQHYSAALGMSEYPEIVCNAPWVSAVIESDGSVMPCFFHKPYGNIYENDFMEIINTAQAVDFRRNLNIAKDPVCKKCVCSLKLGITQK